MNDSRVGLSGFDCRYAFAGDVPTGFYAVHQGAEGAPATVWLQHTETRPTSRMLRIAPLSGAWTMHYEAKATTEHHDSGQPWTWEDLGAIDADSADCEFAPGEIRILPPEGEEKRMKSRNKTATVAIERHRNGRIRTRTY